MDKLNLKNKICIVTGANSGVGKETTRQLVEQGVHVVMVVRNKEKGLRAFEEIKSITKKDTLDLMICDFASQKSIRFFVVEFKKKYTRLDLLINNHGSMVNKKSFTEDNIETTFAVNHLGYFLLTNLLLDLLKKSSHSRIINVSSGAYVAIKKWSLDDYNWNKRKFSSFYAYGESKLYNIMFTQELAKQLKDTGITVNTYTPGFTRTNFGKTTLLMKISLVLMFPFSHSATKAAKTAIYLALSPELTNVTGKYFQNGKIKEISDFAKNDILQKELWDLSSQLTNLQ
ncbi:MAG: SDR family oxidoreductase [Candidatus Heimdallarchaeota archaeon]|nr:SDR family oxidoreductase [Candidatus Heimdallarchaeota archaeon]